MADNIYYNIAPSLTIFSRSSTSNQLVQGDDLYHQNLKSIVLTNRKERLFNYDFGGDLYRHLFNLFPEITINSIQQRLTSLINEYEPRIELRGVQINSDDVNQILNVKIYYTRLTEEQDRIYSKDITFDYTGAYQA